VANDLASGVDIRFDGFAGFDFDDRDAKHCWGTLSAKTNIPNENKPS